MRFLTFRRHPKSPNCAFFVTVCDKRGIKKAPLRALFGKEKLNVNRLDPLGRHMVVVLHFFFVPANLAV
jgi:hypothetical protein